MEFELEVIFNIFCYQKSNDKKIVHYNLEWMETIGKRIIEIENANIILMDYGALSSCNYLYLATRVVYELSNYLASSIQQWRLNVNETRIIGHSLGAQIGKLSANLINELIFESKIYWDQIEIRDYYFEDR